jgi:hypothetical protein
MTTDIAYVSLGPSPIEMGNIYWFIRDCLQWRSLYFSMSKVDVIHRRGGNEKNVRALVLKAEPLITAGF